MIQSIPPIILPEQASKVWLFEQAADGSLIPSTGGGGGGGDVNITGINGLPPLISNPFPVQLSDGTNPIGVDGNPFLIAGAQPVGQVLDTNPVVMGGQDGSGFVTPLNVRFDGTLITAIVDTNGNALLASSSALLVQPQMPGGNTVDAGNGVTGPGTQRVTISSDSTGQVKLAAGTAVIGHVVTDSGSVVSVAGSDGTKADVKTGDTNTISAGLVTRDIYGLDNRELLQYLLLEMRAIRIAIVAMATEDGSMNVEDFAPLSISNQLLNDE